ncbi:MAG: hypothetical protein ACRD3W_22180 [Terriglobales bacterium]
MTRIKAAMDELIAQAKPFTVKELQERSGVKSLETLYAHKALWHAIYVQMKTWSPDITDEYNAVVGAAASESGTLPQDYVQDMPVGRLAARAVVARLSDSAKEHVKAKRDNIHWLLTAYESNWREKAQRHLPPDIADADARLLKSRLPVLLSLLAGAPDEEQQIWLQEQIQAMRDRLDRLSGAGLQLLLIPGGLSLPSENET